MVKRIKRRCVGCGEVKEDNPYGDQWPGLRWNGCSYFGGSRKPETEEEVKAKITELQAEADLWKERLATELDERED